MIRSGAVTPAISSWRVPAAVAVAAAIGVAGCGQGNTPRTASLSDVPLAPGAKVVWQARVCDQGQNAYCSVQFVVTGSRYASAHALRDAQRAALRRHG